MLKFERVMKMTYADGIQAVVRMRCHNCQDWIVIGQNHFDLEETGEAICFACVQTAQEGIKSYLGHMEDLARLEEAGLRDRDMTVSAPMLTRKF